MIDEKELRKVIKQKYAWPGGYPLHLVTQDGQTLCIACARKEYKTIRHSMRNGIKDGWSIDGYGINWESLLYCDHCNQQIESAYDVIDEE